MSRFWLLHKAFVRLLDFAQQTACKTKPIQAAILGMIRAFASCKTSYKIPTFVRVGGYVITPRAKGTQPAVFAVRLKPTEGHPSRKSRTGANHGRVGVSFGGQVATKQACWILA